MKMNENEKIRNRYDRISTVYDLFEQPIEALIFNKWRKLIAGDLAGKVLEVGVGTGKNIPYYPDNVDMTAIDFSGRMLAKARARANAQKQQKQVQFIQMDAQNMNFPDNSFDRVFATFVFCSVPDPVKGLQEIRRVCKPGGKAIMLEHVRSEKQILGLLMDLFNPIPLHLYGANINRRTVENIQKAGFNKVKGTNLMGDVVRKIVMENVK
jgi:ubiquinone/menaquinone biosynthesis C-methylase UbiE